MGKVELKYQDEIDQTLNIDLEGEDAQRAIDLMHKGVRMNKVDKEFGELKREKESLNQLFEVAKTDPVKQKQLLDYLSTELERELTIKEKESIADPDLDPDDKVVKLIEGLKTEVSDLKKSQMNSQKQILGKEINTVVGSLKTRYDGKNGYPVYDQKAVDDFIEENQFYMSDIEKNYEKAYQMMNEEKIKEVDLANATKTEKERKAAIDKSRTETGDDSVTDLDTKDKPISEQSFDDIEVEIRKEMKEKGKSFYKEE